MSKKDFNLKKIKTEFNKNFSFNTKVSLKIKLKTVSKMLLSSQKKFIFDSTFQEHSQLN